KIDFRMVREGQAEGLLERGRAGRTVPREGSAAEVLADLRQRDRAAKARAVRSGGKRAGKTAGGAGKIVRKAAAKAGRKGRCAGAGLSDVAGGPGAAPAARRRR
ncbi:MAG: hypothetical protein ACK5Y0_07865, partial [Pseudomonadota bacterium]